MNLTQVAEELLGLATDPQPFPNSQYEYPINQCLFGQWDIAALRLKALAIANVDLEDQLLTLLALAEAAEAGQPDRAEFFIGDRELRARMVRVNTTAGWALLWGDASEKTIELADHLQRADFQVHIVLPEGSAPPLKQVKSLGARPTSTVLWQAPDGTTVLAVKSFGARPTVPVYFYQAMLRYAHIYGRVPPGEMHEISDFIQDYGPGVMFLTRTALSPVDEALFLGGLALGIPAVVPASFTLPYGTALRAHGPAAMVEAAMGLPNLRLRRRLRVPVDLPFSFDYSFATEEVADGDTLGGTPASSFVVVNEDKGDGIEVIGQARPDVAIQIAVGDPRVDITMTDYLEEFAAKLPAYIEGVAADVADGCPTIRWRAGLPVEPAHLAKAYYAGLKAHFNVQPLKVRLVFQPELLAPMQVEATNFRARRAAALAAASEETEPHFYHCTRCHSFALEHACIITPERPPQCGVRTWTHIKTRAMLSPVDSHGWERWKGAAPLHAPVKKGQCIDEAKGEFAGANAAVRRLTEGRTARVFLHSLFEHPHTACSCFQGVSFYIAEVDGIGLIDVAYKGRTPDGRNWDDIANGTAGKQSSGYAAFGREYLRSRKFLQGDGGWQRVVWMPRALKARFAPDKAWIATEADVNSIAELREFLAINRTP